MDPIPASVFTLAGAIVLLALIYIFKGPKETAKEIDDRVDGLEGRHNALNVGFSEFRAQMLVEMRHWSQEVAQLTQAVRQLTEQLTHVRLTTTGEHRVVKPRRGE